MAGTETLAEMEARIIAQVTMELKARFERERLEQELRARIQKEVEAQYALQSKGTGIIIINWQNITQIEMDGWMLRHGLKTQQIMVS